LHVLSRIQNNTETTAKEIKEILNIEMQDSLCKCYTGRMSRLINCLNGFDPLVKIQISGAEQIGQIIGLTREQLDNEGNYTAEEHKRLVKKELEDRDYSQEEISEWIEYIE